MPEKEKPEAPQPEDAVPWKRGPKKAKPIEETPEEKQWPTGKRRPKPEEEKEEITLKPIPKPKKDIEPKPEKEVEGPQFKPHDLTEVLHILITHIQIHSFTFLFTTQLYPKIHNKYFKMQLLYLALAKQYKGK